MQGDEVKRVIVILGSGRSGTSVLMQVLAALGMSISADMIPAKEQTPTGTYEDREIFQIQNELVSAMTPQAMPMPAGWEDNIVVPPAMKQLQAIVTDRLEKSSTIWGFKDPKTVMLIPMWTRIFNTMNLVPKYILSVRNPQSVVASMKRQYGTKQDVAELFWLSKYTEALHHTGGNCFIVHYEDWFTERARQIGEQLLRYSGLAPYFVQKDVGEALGTVLQPNLNRAVYDDYEVKNRFVRDMYEELKICRGDSFQRPELMKVVGECRRAMDEFSGWASEARRFMVSSQAAWKKGAGKSPQQEQELAALKKELNKSIIDANDCLQQNKDFRDELESLRIHCSGIKNEYAGKRQEFEAEKKKTDKLAGQLKNERNQLRHENFSLRTSTSFRVGQVMVQAVARPGKNTILLPLNLARIVLGQRVAKLKK